MVSNDTNSVMAFPESIHQRHSYFMTVAGTIENIYYTWQGNIHGLETKHRTLLFATDLKHMKTTFRSHGSRRGCAVRTVLYSPGICRL